MSDSKTASRRDFLKGGTAAAAGLALAGGLNIARTAHAAGERRAEDRPDRLRRPRHRRRGKLPAIRCENVKLIAVADAFAERAKGCAEELKKKYRRQDGPARRSACSSASTPIRRRLPPAPTWC